MIIEISTFTPFKNGREVIRLQFEYDEAFIATLKRSLRDFRPYATDEGVEPAGGWLPDHRSWWVHPEIWHLVQTELEAIGGTIVPTGLLPHAAKARSPWHGRTCGSCKGRVYADNPPITLHEPGDCDSKDCAGWACWNCIRPRPDLLAQAIRRASEGDTAGRAGKLGGHGAAVTEDGEDGSALG